MNRCLRKLMDVYRLLCMIGGQDHANHQDTSASGPKLTSKTKGTHLDVALHELQPPV
jgi:hypothetical protein